MELANMPLDEMTNINTEFSFATSELDPINDQEFDMGLPSELVQTVTSVLPSLNLDADFSTETAGPSLNPFDTSFQP